VVKLKEQVRPAYKGPSRGSSVPQRSHPVSYNDKDKHDDEAVSTSSGAVESEAWVDDDLAPWAEISDDPWAEWDAGWLQLLERRGTRRAAPSSSPVERRCARVLSRAAELLWAQAELPASDFGRVQNLLTDAKNPVSRAKCLIGHIQSGRASLAALELVHAARGAWRPLNPQAKSPLSWAFGLRLLRAFEHLPTADELVAVLDDITAAWREIIEPGVRGMRLKDLMEFVERVACRSDLGLDLGWGTRCLLESWLVGPVRDERARASKRWLGRQLGQRIEGEPPCI